MQLLWHSDVDGCAYRDHHHPLGWRVNIQTTVNVSLTFLDPATQHKITCYKLPLQLYSKAHTKASYNGLIKMGRNAFVTFPEVASMRYERFK